MELAFDRNKKRIEEIYRDFANGKLVVDPTYQRRKVWIDQDKVRLIETILMGLVIPEVFFWPSNIDPDTGTMLTHIVDGQQRINAISEFIAGEFKLMSKYLMNKDIFEQFADRKFNELTPEAKTAIWSYRISVVEIDRSCTKEDITQMFYRLNLTNYSLNPQEKRNSLESAFGDKADALSLLDFWKTSKVFSSTDAKRMKDVEYCCSIFILANEGINDQTNGKKINDYYDDYKNNFDENDILANKIYMAIEIIKNLSDKSTIQFVSKKAQMYSLFCLAFKMIQNQIELNKDIFEKFKLFVTTYNKFRNEFNVLPETQSQRDCYENIKRYKLASSEGINKVGNRVIRFEVLFKMCIDSTDEIKGNLKYLSATFDELLKQKETSFDQLENDDLIDISDDI